ncbi:MAG: LPS export ABC transporter periplasmic protein LptC [Muribaculaceae bacterium]|nr:LPS export ABC transporter periplasmic protein LptC [Muribaculaceae bacterium]
MRRLPLLIISLALVASACHKPERTGLSKAPPGQLVPTMITDSVSTLVSDSGYTRYHIVAPVWLMYEDAPDPYWTFPQGLTLEQYDEQMRPAADVRCDSAVYFSRRRLWRLDGNVVMVNTLRDSFLTEQVFWDQTRQMVYSDSFIHIVRSDRVINGYGFESNQSMTAYTVNRPTGIIPVERPAPAQTSASDSSGLQPARRQSAPPPPSQRGADDPIIVPPVRTTNHNPNAVPFKKSS